MNVIPSIDRDPAPNTRMPWMTGAVVTILALTMASAIVVDVLYEIIWPTVPTASAVGVPQQHASAGIVEQYTRFRTEKIEGGEVVTGFEYTKSTDPAPRSQYCYLMMHRETRT